MLGLSNDESGALFLFFHFIIMLSTFVTAMR